MLKKAFVAQREFIVLASKSQKPSNVSPPITALNLLFLLYTCMTGSASGPDEANPVF